MSDSLKVDGLSGVMAKVILVFLMEAGALSVRDLSAHTGVTDAKTLRLACDELCRVNGLLEQRQGAYGRRSWARSGLLTAWGSALAGQVGEKPRDGEPVAARKGEQVGENPRKVGGGVPTQGVSLKSLRQDSTLKDISLKDSLKIPKNGIGGLVDAAGEAEKRLWLEKAGLLFDKPVRWEASFAAKDALEMLGWLAQAYEAWRNQKLERPWGLVYRALRGELRQQQPDQRYRAEPWLNLPGEYLAACGLEVFACRLCRQQFASRAELEAHLPDCPELLEDEVEPEDSQPQAALSPEVQHWEFVLGMLKTEMPPNWFESWLADTRALDWIAAEGVLRVAAGSPRAVEWLDNRVRRSAETLLRGLMMCEVRVEFVYEAAGEVRPEKALLFAAAVNPQAVQGYGRPLTAAQLRVVRLLVQGKQRDQIARELGISRSTVNVHLARIFLRLGAGNAAEAVALALERGLLGR